MNAPIIEIKDEDYALWYADFAEKTENYLLSIGITEREIQAIKEIMLEAVE